MERILIIGPCGSGKSTLARKLADQLKLPTVHLDQLFWRENWQAVSQEEFDRLLEEKLRLPKWIMDGNFHRTLEHRIQYCDTIIYLDYSTVQCLYGVIKRVITHYGKTREDMGPSCPERFDWEFVKYVWSFNKRYRKQIYKMLNGLTMVNIYHFKNRKSLKKFLINLHSNKIK